jgi:hypothetical protein
MSQSVSAVQKENSRCFGVSVSKRYSSARIKLNEGVKLADRSIQLPPELRVPELGIATDLLIR